MLKTLFGEWQWQRPNWLSNHPGLGVMLAGLLVLGMLASLYLALRSPPVALVAVEITAPVIADNPETISPLILEFSAADPNDGQREFARLDLIGRTIDSGAQLNPELAGEWRWQSPTTLQFVPSQHWPAGMRYDVDLTASIMADRAPPIPNDLAFESPAFDVEVESFEFHKDPGPAGLTQVIANFRFSHAVTDENLRAAIALARQADTGGPQDIDFEIGLDSSRRQGWLRSETIRLADQPNFATLTVAKNLRAEQGGTPLAEARQAKVVIPANSEFFKVTDAQAQIIRDEDENTAQALTLRFSDQVSNRELTQQLELYLLPRNARIRDQLQRDYSWRSASEVTDSHIADATPVEFSLNPARDGVTDLHSLALDLPENRYLYVRVNAGLASEAGYPLARPYTHVLRTPAYPRETRIAADGALLPMSSSQKLTLIARGVNAIKVEIARVDESQLNHLATQTNGDVKSPNFSNYNFNKDNLTQIRERIVPVRGRVSEALYTHIDLSEFATSGGFFFVTVQGWNLQQQYAVGSRDQRFILVTDLGLMTKANADSTHDVFVHSLANGTPLAGARVDLLGKNGAAIATRITNADGHTKLPATGSFGREKSPSVFVVRRGDDTTFLPFGRRSQMLMTSRFDVGGEYVDPGRVDAALRAQLLTDRGLYRPGETVKLGAIVKRGDWRALPAVPLEITIRDPRGQTVLRRELRFGGAGLGEASYVSDEISATGTYYVTLDLIDTNKYRQTLGSTTFRLEEFQPDRLKIRSRIVDAPAKGWLDGGSAVAEVTLRNLFGSPAQDRKISGRIELIPTTLTFKDFPGYTFTDPLRDPDVAAERVELALADTRTDKEGQVLITLPVQDYDQGIYRLNAYLEGFKPGEGRSVQTRATAIIAPLGVLVGHKAETPLDFVRKDSEVDARFIALNPTAETVALDALTLRLVARRMVATLTQQANGTLAYESIPSETVRQTTSTAIAAGGTALPLDTSETGEFELQLLDASERIVGRLRYTVVGTSSTAGDMSADTELSVALDRSSYAAGDTIELSIQAPYEGRGLITIERDQVYAYQWFETTPGSSIQRIQLPSGLEGNAYVNVALVRSMDSPSIFMNPLSYAVEPFAINRDARVLDIELDVPERVKPGEALSIDYRTSAPSKVLVYAVDEGILQVANYQTPRPLEFFLRKLALQVESFQMVDLLISDFERYRRLAAPGGGEAFARAGANLNPFRRQVDAPAVYWSGVVDAGPQAKTLRFPVPDSFSGQLRIMAIGATDQRVGHTEQSTEVRGPFVITPDAPLAVAPGDEFEFSVSVANLLEKGTAAISVDLTLDEHAENIGVSSHELTLENNAEGTVSFQLRATEKLGGAVVTVTAIGAGEQLSRTASFSVRPATARRTTLTTGSTQESTTTIDTLRQMRPEFSEQTALSSASPRILVNGLQSYLNEFPHACAEQIVSKVFPQLGLLGQRDSEVDNNAIREQFRETLAKLQARQQGNGGFSFWLNSTESARFPSTYVTHFLTDAKTQGLAVPTAMLDKALQFLREIAALQSTDLPSARLRAYAIYVLTRNGIVTSNYLADLASSLNEQTSLDWQSDLTAIYIAASYAMLQQVDAARDLLGAYKMGAESSSAQLFQTRLAHDAQYVYVLARHFPDRLTEVNAEAIRNLVEPVMQDRFNTLSSAYTILALQALDQRTDATPTRASWTLIDRDGTREVGAWSNIASATPTSTTQALELGANGDDPLYYVVSQTGFDQTAVNTAGSSGLEVSRLLLNADGDAVTGGEVGDELTVVLRVRATERAVSQVAVVDLIPGGASIVRESVDGSANRWRADYVDVREDRLVLYGNFDQKMTEIRYRLRLTHAGKFQVPGASAASMYDRSISANSAAAELVVTRQP